MFLSSVVYKSLASEPHGIVAKIRISGPHSRDTESELFVPGNLYFNKFSNSQHSKLYRVK